MKTSTPMGVLDMVPLDTFFACACYSFFLLPAENDEGWVDVDEMVGTEIDLYAGCNALWDAVDSFGVAKRFLGVRFPFFGGLAWLKNLFGLDFELCEDCLYDAASFENLW